MTTARLLTLLALIVLTALAAPSPAAADKPCWVKLVNDWYDGRIDGTYPARCYRDALKNIPDDLKGYSDAEEDIRRALLAATREKGHQLEPDELIEPQPRDETETNGAPNKEDDPGDAEAVPGDPGDDGGGGLLDAFRPSNADSVPIPLLVLAGLALILLAAAATSFVARRIQARRLRVAPLPRPPQNP